MSIENRVSDVSEKSLGCPVLDKSIQALKEIIEKDPERVRKILEKAGEKKYGGPTVDEYFNNLGHSLTSWYKDVGITTTPDKAT